MKNNDIEVAVADDHTLFREGLINIISSMEEFRVTVQAGNGKLLLKELEQAKSLPQVLLLDINMPVMNGYKTMAAVKEKFPALNVLTLSMYEAEFSVIQMFRLGAKGYLEKDRNAEELRAAMLAVHEGDFYHSGELSGKILHHLQKGYPLTGITERESEFLSHCCTELTYKEIADLMNISERTVHGYRNILFDKLNLKSRTGLAIFALNAGIANGI